MRRERVCGFAALLLLASCTSTSGTTSTLTTTSPSTVVSATSTSTAQATTSTIIPPTTVPSYVTESGYPMEMGWHPTDPNVTLPQSPYPEWQGGDELRLGPPRRYWVVVY